MSRDLSNDATFTLQNYSSCWEFFTGYNDHFSCWRMLLFLFTDLKYGISLTETWYWSFIFHKERRLCFLILGLLSANHFFLFTILHKPSAEYESILETILFTSQNHRILKIRKDLRDTQQIQPLSIHKRIRIFHPPQTLWRRNHLNFISPTL